MTFGANCLHAQEVTVTWGRHGGCTGRGICAISNGADRNLQQNQATASLFYSEQKAVILRISKDSLSSSKEDYLLNDQLLQDNNDQYFLSVEATISLPPSVKQYTGKTLSSQLHQLSSGSYRVYISEAHIDIYLVE